MPEIKIRNAKDLEKLLKKVVNNAMKEEVSKNAIETMRDKIDTEVYENTKYTPKEYRRTYKLRKRVKTEMIDETSLELYNYRFDEDEKYYQENKFVYVVKNLLQELIDKVPNLEEAKDFVEMAEKEISKFDPNKVKFIKDFIDLNKEK